MKVCGICDCILYFVLILFELDILIYFFHNLSFYVIYLLKFFKNNMILKYNIINNHKHIIYYHIIIINKHLLFAKFINSLFIFHIKNFLFLTRTYLLSLSKERY